MKVESPYLGGWGCEDIEREIKNLKASEDNEGIYWEALLRYPVSNLQSSKRETGTEKENQKEKESYAQGGRPS